MGKVSEILNQTGSLVPKSQDIIATSQQFSTIEQLREAGVPEWEIAMFQMAQGKRHDLPRETILRWREKLSSYKDDEIRHAIMLYCGEFFPDVDEIIKTIDRCRQAQYEQAEQDKWQDWRAKQRKAAEEGKLATEEDYAWLREQFKRVIGRSDATTEGSSAAHQGHAAAKDLRSTPAVANSPGVSVATGGERA